GDLVPASFARLTIQSADATAPTTKIKAQLARNALGDQVGTGLLPPIPTAWGDTASQAIAIASAFFNSETTFKFPRFAAISLPIPAYAVPSSADAPVNIGRSPAVNAPNFQVQEGHLCQGCSVVDAFWALGGDFTPTSADNTFLTFTN